MSEFLERIAQWPPRRLALLAAKLQRQLQEKGQSDEPIAIIGAACRFPQADGPGAYWDLLRAGRDTLREVPADRWNVAEWYDPDPAAPGKMYTRHGSFLDGIEQFDPEHFHILPREAMSMDPQQRLLLEVGWRALENAGLRMPLPTSAPAGVFVGVGLSNYGGGVCVNAPERLDLYSISGNISSVAAGRLGHAFGFAGPNLPIDTACSSSLVAVHQAVRSLRHGECRMALAGGVNLVMGPEGNVYFCRLGILSRQGFCASYDASADGYVRGEGCGMVVLKRLSDAQADGDSILALIRGSAVNHNGRGVGLLVPSGSAQESVMRQALLDASAEAGEIAYVEGQGTGTLLGDAIELQALGAVYGKERTEANPLLLGCVKTNLGHLEIASGIASLIKVALALHHREIPGQLHYRTANPHADLRNLHVEIVRGHRPWPESDQPLRAGVNAFGISGNNAHLILEEPPQPKSAPRPGREKQVLILSASGEQPLNELAGAYAKYLGEHPETPLEAIATATNTARSELAQRLTLTASSTAEAATILASGAATVIPPARERQRVVLYLGEPRGWAGLEGQAWLTGEAIVQSTLAEFQRELPADLAPLWPRVVGVMWQCALARLWIHWGILPDLLLASDGGEISAAVLTGLLSPAQALRLAATGKLVERVAPSEETPTHDLVADIYSATTGKPLRAEQALDPAFWACALGGKGQPLVELARLPQRGYRMILPVGPALPWLEPPAPWRYLPHIESGSEGWSAIVDCLRELVLLGRPVAWRNLAAPGSRAWLDLPGYPFQRQRYWIETVSAQRADATSIAEAEAAPAGDSPAQLRDWLAVQVAGVTGLARERLDPETSLLNLGLDSLQAVELRGRIESALSLEVSLGAILEAPGLSALARSLTELRRAPVAASLPPLEASAEAPAGAYPLTPAQLLLWLWQIRERDAAALLNPMALRIRGSVLPEALESALATLVHRHVALRTTFVVRDGQVLQIIAPAPASASASGTSVNLERVEASEETLDERLHELVRQPLDVFQGPLWRAVLVRVGPDDHVLLIILHHLISDGWSMGLLAREALALYLGFAGGMPSILEPTRCHYTDYVRWLARCAESPAWKESLGFWEKKLSGAPALLQLPLDRPRPAEHSSRGKSLTFTLPAETRRRMEHLCHGEGRTLFVGLLATFGVLLARLSRQDDLCLACPTAGRIRPALEEIVGPCLAHLVVRLQLGDRPSFRELLGRLGTEVREAMDHQIAAPSHLVDQLMRNVAARQTPLYQVVFLYQNLPAKLSAFPGWELTPVRLELETAPTDLTLTVVPFGQDLHVEWQFSSDLFDATTVERWHHHWLALIEAVLTDPEAGVHDYELLSAPELNQVLALSRGPTVDVPPELCLHSLFERQVSRTPDAVALRHDNQALTFRELDDRASHLARHLQARGVGPEVLVGLAMPFGFEMAIGLLGILKAGGAYVPLDPTYPEGRIAYLLADSKPLLVLTQRALLHRAPDQATQCLDPDEPLWTTAAPEVRGAIAPTRENLACVLYTSGSTGQPKGVAIPHRVAVNRFFIEANPLQPGEVLVGKTSINFVDSMWELFCSWGNGLCCSLVSQNQGRDLNGLLNLFERERITRVLLVPSLLRALLEMVPSTSTGPGQVPDRLRWWITSGEALPADLAQTFRARWPERVLINLYGTTEVWDATQADTRGRAEGEAVPIGKPLGNVEVLVLDRRLRPVPAGVVGEIHIGGPGLARCYRGRPGLTAERFIPHPLARTPGERLYRTGDLGRWLPSGELEYLGRADQQFQVRGYRIEPGEIEGVLRTHPRIRQAAVMMNRRGLLVAFVEPIDGGEMDMLDLRRFARRHLPDYQAPSLYQVVPRLPLTPTGKLDRRALPSADTVEFRPGAAFEAPRTPTEERLVKLWRELLTVPQVGVHDDFFDLGGHSLLATQMLTRAAPGGVPGVTFAELVERLTVARLAELIDGAGAVSEVTPSAIPLVDRSGPLVLSPAQERLWFLDRLHPDGAAYNLAVALRVRGQLDLDLLRRSVEVLQARHEPLRVIFAEENGRPVQRVTSGQTVTLPVQDLTQASPAEAHRWAEDVAKKPFDLARGPLLRVEAARLASGEFLLAVAVHHIASDGWSISVIVRELATLYFAAQAGLAAPLPPLRVQYADYAVWQRQRLATPEIAEQVAFWRERLTGLQPLELPSDHPRPPVFSFRGKLLPARISASVQAGLHRLARECGATPFMVLLSAFKVFLSWLSGRQDLAVGTPIAGRSRPELEGLIGLFVNTLVPRTNLGGDPTFTELIGRVKHATLAALQHPDVPFERLVEALDPPRDPSRPPLVQVVFVLHNLPVPNVSAPGLEILPQVVDTGTAKFDLTLYATETPDGLLLAWEYNTDLFEPATVERWQRRWAALLEAVVAEPGAPLSRLMVPSESERRTLLEDWNATSVEYPREATLGELFAEQAAKTPTAPALVWDGGSWTYAELDERATELAGHLQAQGVGRGDLVGLALERSPDMILALLAIVRAGAAYLPLDPDLPPMRLVELVEQAAPRVVLTSHRHRAALAGLGRLVFVEERRPGTVVLQDSPEAGDRAYVLYTSGSTGQARGVAVSHRAIVRLVRPMRFCPVEPGDVFLHAAPASFDAATFEIWGSLLNGATLALFPTGPAGADVWRQTLRRHGVNVLWLTAGLFHLLVEEDLDALTGLRALLAGGDVLSPVAVRRFLQRFPECALINGYGPTEATTFATTHGITPADLDRPSIPIGRPIQNTRAYVLTPALAPAPVGVPGELYLAGDGLAMGYLNRPSLTAERFVPDPFGAPGSRLYRTGDRVRWLAEGTLEFLGRQDRQVKVRGFRVEPAEVEAALAQHPGVRASAVILAEKTQRLVGYWVSAPGSDVDALALREFLRDRLPAYLIPSLLVEVPILPLTPSGKLDRAALPEVALRTRAAGEFAEPHAGVERLVADVWAELLGVEQVGREDDFFTLGGHSLLAVRAAVRLSLALGREVPLRAFFERPTLAELAGYLERGESSEPALPPLRPLEHAGPAPLSFAQERIWFLNEFAGGLPLFNIPLAVRVRGPLALDVLQAALADLQERHEVLRSRIRLVDGQPVQEVESPAFQVQRVDLSGEPAETLAMRLREAACRPFDLATAPLWRACVFDLGPDDHAVLLVVHHVAADGWSMGVLLRDLIALYQARRLGRTPAVPTLPVCYRDYAVWQRDERAQARARLDLDYWRDYLADSSGVLTLPTDRPRPAQQTFRGGLSGFLIPADLRRSILEVCRTLGVTPFLVLLTGFQVVLARWARQADVTVGTPTAGRSEASTANLVGPFVNTLAWRVDLSPNPTFAELLERVHQTAASHHARASVPFERIVNEIQPQRDLSRAPLFQVLFAHLDLTAPVASDAGLTFEPLPVDTGTAKADLTLYINEADGRLHAGWEYNSDLFDPATVDRLHSSFLCLLGAACAAPQQAVQTLPLLTGEELAKTLALGAGPSVALPQEESLAALFEAQAARTPRAVALVTPDATWTYAALETWSRRLSLHLRKQGVQAGDRVGIHLGREPAGVAALLAVLRLGATYVPINPALPGPARDRILTSAGLRVVVGRTPLDSVVLIPPEAEGEIDDSPATLTPLDAVAFIIYTSGSTGEPKGVMGTHRCVVNRLATEPFPLEASDVCCLKTELNFIDSLWEVFAPLTLGLMTTIPPAEWIGAPARLIDFLEATGVTRLMFVPSLLRALLDAGVSGRLPQLRYWYSGGEALPPEVAARFQAARPDATLVNGYGISEVWDVTAHICDGSVIGTSVPIGPAFPNVQVRLLDERLQPVPVGVVGEIFVGGPGLARGYLHRPDLTATRFVPDPFGTQPGARLYRTGDLGRYLPDGNLIHAGRADRQLKLHGYRIEAGEIEAALARLPGLRAATVVLHESARLVAFAVLEEGVTTAPETLARDLRRRLALTLPGYLVPQVLHFLPELPMLLGGKINRAALARLPLPARTEEATSAPQTELERRVAAIWGKLLDVEQVSPADDFFDLGGHSLLGVQMLSRLRTEIGVEVPLLRLFEGPTVAEVAVAVEEAMAGPAPLALLPIGEVGPRPPLAPAQHRLWLLAQMAPESSAYHLPLAVRVRGALRLDLLERAGQILVRRHEALRTALVNDGDEPYQKVLPFTPEPLQVETLAGGEADLERRLREASAQPFDLATGPLSRCCVFRVADDDHVVLFVLHHLIADGWSLVLLARELGAIYLGLAEARPIPLAPLPWSYAAYATWHRRLLEQVEERERTYWVARLRGARFHPLPGARPVSALTLGFPGRTLGVQVPPALTESLRTLARQQGVTLYMVLVAGLHALLHRLTDRSDITLLTGTAGRNHPNLEGLVGFLVNTLALRLDLADRPNFGDLLKRVRGEVLQGLTHAVTPFDRVAQAAGLLAPDASLGSAVMFTLQNFSVAGRAPLTEPAPLVGTDGIRMEPVFVDTGAARFDLELLLTPVGDGLAGTLVYRTDRFDEADITPFFARYLLLLEAAVREPSRRVEEFDLTTAEEREQLESWSTQT